MHPQVKVRKIQKKRKRLLPRMLNPSKPKENHDQVRDPGLILSPDHNPAPVQDQDRSPNLAHDPDQMIPAQDQHQHLTPDLIQIPALTNAQGIVPGIAHLNDLDDALEDAHTHALDLVLATALQRKAPDLILHIAALVLTLPQDQSTVLVGVNRSIIGLVTLRRH